MSMRTHLFRVALTFAVLFTLSAAPALAQSIVRGKVVDAQNKAVEGATVTFEQEGTNRKSETKTNKNGEYLQVGLASGNWKITAAKDGVGTQAQTRPVSQGRPTELNFNLAAGGGAAGGADGKAAAELQAAAKAAQDALNAGRFDEAITQFKDLATKVPTCGECYYNLGVAYNGKNQSADAEAAFNKSNEIKPTADAYGQLARLYNSQKKFDQAAAAGAKAAELSASTPGGGGNAEASYNQGVILFNGGKYAESKAQFEAAVKADPKYAPAYYQLGMAALNLGQIPDAVAALEKYMEVAPDGPKAAEVKASLPALQGMLKK
jgi:tetratricopeptide (TPR) repeat protein